MVNLVSCCFDVDVMNEEASSSTLRFVCSFEVTHDALTFVSHVIHHKSSAFNLLNRLYVRLGVGHKRLLHVVTRTSIHSKLYADVTIFS